MMKIQVTPLIQSFLRDTTQDHDLPQALRLAAGNWVEAEALPWAVLRDLCATVRAARQGQAPKEGPKEGPWAHELCRGGGLELPQPPARSKTKTPELEAHLERLRRKLEQDSYNKMVQDITQKERGEQERMEGGLRSYRQQMSFGLHIVVMMGTFYAFGHALGVYLGSGSRLLPMAVGLIFMVGALIMETLLFIIRTTVPPRLEPAMDRRVPPEATGAPTSQQQGAAGQQQGTAGQQQREARQQQGRQQEGRRKGTKPSSDGAQLAQQGREAAAASKLADAKKED